MHTLLCDGRVYTLTTITVEPPGFTLIGTPKAGAVTRTKLQWSNIAPPGGLIVQARALDTPDVAIEVIVVADSGEASVYVTPDMGPLLILCPRRVVSYYANLRANDALSANQVTDVQYKANIGDQR